MAQKIQTLFIDDIDGGEADGTVRFALDGTEYEIDLSAQHSAELHTALGMYVTHARKTGGAARRGVARASNRKSSTVDTGAVRAWARENGYDIKDRGRVPADLVEKYQAANVSLSTLGWDAQVQGMPRFKGGMISACTYGSAGQATMERAAES